MRLLKYLIVGVSVFIAFINLESQPAKFNFTIKGKIIESQTKQPLEFVSVAVYGVADSALVSGCISQSDGSFSIQADKPGRYYLTADFVGFEKTVIQEVILKPGKEIFDAGEIAIAPKSMGIEQVEVVSDKPFVSYKIDRKVIDVSQNPSAQGGTAVDALQNVPSIQTDIEGNITLRGNSNFTVLIDGRQSPLSGTDALNQIPANAIDKIEIITNPSVKYDPDGTAGIINIVTKKGKLTGHSLVLNTSVGSSPMFSSDLTYSYRRKKTTFTASIGYRNMQNSMKSLEDSKKSFYDSINSIYSIDRLYKRNKGLMENIGFSAKGGVDYQLTDNNTINIGGGYQGFTFGRNFNTKINQHYLEPYDTFEITASKNNTHPEIWQFNIGDRQIFQKNSEHYITVDLQYQNVNGINTDMLEMHESNMNWDELTQIGLNQQAKTYNKSQQYRTEVAYQLPIPKLFTIETGYTLRVYKSKMNYERWVADSINTDSWLQNSSLNDESNFSSFINAGWFLIKGDLRGIQYSAGLRGESTNQSIKTIKDNYQYKYDYLGWYPSFALTKEWEGGHTLQVNYTKRINRPQDWRLSPFPGLSDGYNLYLPNPELKPEHAGSYELNYQKSWNKSFVSVETFYRNTEGKMENTHVTKNDTTIHQMINQGKDIQIGSEFTGNIVLAKWCIINPKATFYYYEAEGIIDSVKTNVKSNTWEAGLTGNFILPSKTRIQLVGQYRAPEIELDGKGKEMYWLSASAMQGFFDQKLMVILRVDDIFNTRKRIETQYNGNTVVYSERQRKSPTFVLSVNYRFNQNGEKKKNGKNGEDQEGGGMDMDF